MIGLRTFVWGSGGSGQLGLGSEDDCSVPHNLVTISKNAIDPRTITTGGCHTAGLSKDGHLYLWGDNERLQLARPQHERRLLEPALHASITKERIMTVACGWTHTVVVVCKGSDNTTVIDQEVHSWGAHQHSQLGRPNTAGNPVGIRGRVTLPTLARSRRVISLSCGWKHSLLVLDGGTVFSWGTGRNGELGLGRSRLTASEPNEVAFPSEFRIEKAYCGWQHSVFHCSRSGAVLVCGNNRHGQLGVPKEVEGVRFKPSRVMLKDGIRQLRIRLISVGWHFALCISTEGHIYAWGKGTHGQLGLGMFDNAEWPTKSCFAGDVISVACGSEHSMVVTARGELFTCGWGEHGNLGHGDLENRCTLTKVNFFDTNSLRVISATAGGAVSIAHAE